MKRITPFAIGLLMCLPLLRAADEPQGKPATPDKAELEKKFGQTMSHARLIGFYSTTGQEGPPKQDEYTMGEVHKGEGDKWVFNASLQFGKQVMNVPLEIPVLWAGDTPVISVTDMTIPGMGTYTARVMISGDHYAGTWSSAKHGGYMWGRIDQIPAKTSNPNEQKK